MKEDISRFIFISLVMLSLGVFIGVAIERIDDRNTAEEQEPEVHMLYVVEENMIGNISTTGDFNRLFSGKIISIKE